MNFLITGGAGFIGSHFTKMLLTNKFDHIPEKVIVLDKLTYSGSLFNLRDIENCKNFEFVHGDICDSELVNKLVSSVDVVINFAAESHVDRSIESSIEFIESNVLGVAVLLDAIKSSPKTRFIQISTDEVYGSISKGSWKEDFPLAPNSPYAASKASGDLLALAFNKTHKLDIRITRCSNNYGPNQHSEKIIPNFLLKLMDGQRVPVYGDGSNYREWIYVEDHCKGIWKVLTQGRAGEIYNIGSGFEISNIELTRKLISYFGDLIFEESIEYVQDRKGHDFRYSVNSSKIANELGFVCETDFDKGLTNTVNWYRENRREIL